MLKSTPEQIIKDAQDRAKAKQSPNVDDWLKGRTAGTPAEAPAASPKDGAASGISGLISRLISGAIGAWIVKDGAASGIKDAASGTITGRQFASFSLGAIVGISDVMTPRADQTLNNIDKSSKFYAFAMGAALATVVLWAVTAPALMFFAGLAATVLSSVLGRINGALDNVKRNGDKGQAGNIILELGIQFAIVAVITMAFAPLVVSLLPVSVVGMIEYLLLGAITGFGAFALGYIYLTKIPQTTRKKDFDAFTHGMIGSGVLGAVIGVLGTLLVI